MIKKPLYNNGSIEEIDTQGQEKDKDALSLLFSLKVNSDTLLSE